MNKGENKVNQTPTMSFPLAGILGLIFITLKLTGVIAWSWVWVLAPFWIPIIFVIILFTIAICLAPGSNRK